MPKLPTLPHVPRVLPHFFNLPWEKPAVTTPPPGPTPAPSPAGTKPNFPVITAFGTAVDGQHYPGEDHSPGIAPVARVQHYITVTPVSGVTMDVTAALTAIMADGTSRTGTLAVTRSTEGFLTEPYAPQGWGSGYSQVYQVRVQMAVTARDSAGTAGPVNHQFTVTVDQQTPAPGSGTPPPPAPTPPPASTITGSAIVINGNPQTGDQAAALDTDGVGFALVTTGPAAPSLTLDVLSSDGSTYSLTPGMSRAGNNFQAGPYSARQLAGARGSSADVIELQAHWTVGGHLLTQTVNITPSAVATQPPPGPTQPPAAPVLTAGMYLNGQQYDGSDSAQVTPDETYQCYVVIPNPVAGLTYRAEASLALTYADGVAGSPSLSTQAVTMTSWMTPVDSFGNYGGGPDGEVYQAIVTINVYADDGQAESPAATQTFTLTNPNAQLSGASVASLRLPKLPSLLGLPWPLKKPVTAKPPTVPPPAPSASAPAITAYETLADVNYVKGPSGYTDAQHVTAKAGQKLQHGVAVTVPVGAKVIGTDVRESPQPGSGPAQGVLKVSPVRDYDDNGNPVVVPGQFTAWAPAYTVPNSPGGTVQDTLTVMTDQGGKVTAVFTVKIA